MIIVTADLHLSDNPRDANRHVFMRSLIKLAEQRQARAIYALGDFTEEKDRHSAWLVNATVDYFHALSQICDVFALQGNHDYLADPANAFYAFLRRVPRIHWINKPTQIGRHLFLPHSRDYERDWRGLDFESPDWIFAHQTFKGARSEHGAELDGVPVDVFPRNARVIAGDIHTPQRVGPVTYVGAPYLVDFGDDYVPRVLLIPDDNRLISLPCPGAQKRLVEIVVKPGKRLSFDIVHSSGGVPRRGDLLKIRADLSQVRAEDWPEVRKEIQWWCDDNGLGLHSLSRTKSSQTKTARPMLTNRKNDQELVRHYSQQFNLDSAVLKAGLEIVETL